MYKPKSGELIIYINGDTAEIGEVKRVVNDGAFVYYSCGDTAAKTPFDCMYKLINAYVIGENELGGKMKMRNNKSLDEIDLMKMEQKYEEDKKYASAVNGNWEHVGSLSCRCSECGCKNDRETRFCPNCGAKMDLEEHV